MSVEEIKKKLKSVNADIVINCIGQTNVETCEANPKLAEFANIEIAGNISKACGSCGIKLVHISTDHLFDGQESFVSELTPYSPLNNYGISKSKEGEQEVLKNNSDAIIIRTNFFGSGPSYKASFQTKF